MKVDARTNAGDATESLDAALCSGYIDTPTSNRLDRLEERGVVFENQQAGIGRDQDPHSIIQFEPAAAFPVCFGDKNPGLVFQFLSLLRPEHPEMDHVLLKRSTPDRGHRFSQEFLASSSSKKPHESSGYRGEHVTLPVVLEKGHRVGEGGDVASAADVTLADIMTT